MPDGDPVDPKEAAKTPVTPEPPKAPEATPAPAPPAPPPPPAAPKPTPVVADVAPVVATPAAAVTPAPVPPAPAPTPTPPAPAAPAPTPAPVVAAPPPPVAPTPAPVAPAVSAPAPVKAPTPVVAKGAEPARMPLDRRMMSGESYIALAPIALGKGLRLMPGDRISQERLGRLARFLRRKRRVAVEGDPGIPWALYLASKRFNLPMPEIKEAPKHQTDQEVDTELQSKGFSEDASAGEVVMTKGELKLVSRGRGWYVVVDAAGEPVDQFRGKKKALEWAKG